MMLCLLSRTNEAFLLPAFEVTRQRFERRTTLFDSEQGISHDSRARETLEKQGTSSRMRTHFYEPHVHLTAFQHACVTPKITRESRNGDLHHMEKESQSASAPSSLISAWNAQF